MKTTFIALLVFAALMATAQTRQEFSLNVSESTITLKPGETRQVGISIVRSKGFTKGDVTLSLSNALPTGITVTYDPAVGHFDVSTATITASPTATAGTYQLVLNATIQNKVKGTILKVAVNNESVSTR